MGVGGLLLRRRRKIGIEKYDHVQLCTYYMYITPHENDFFPQDLASPYRCYPRFRNISCLYNTVYKNSGFSTFKDLDALHFPLPLSRSCEQILTCSYPTYVPDFFQTRAFLMASRPDFVRLVPPPSPDSCPPYSPPCFSFSRLVPSLSRRLPDFVRLVPSPLSRLRSRSPDFVPVFLA